MKQKNKKNLIAELVNKLVDARIKKILPEMVKNEVNSYILLLNEQIEEKNDVANKPKATPSMMNMVNESVQREPMSVREEAFPQRKKPQVKTGNPAIDAVLTQTDSRREYEKNSGFALSSQMEGTPSFAPMIQEGMEEYPNLMNRQVFTHKDIGMIHKPVATVDTMISAEGKRVSSDSYAGQLVNSVMNRDYTELVKRFKK